MKKRRYSKDNFYKFVKIFGFYFFFKDFCSKEIVSKIKIVLAVYLKKSIVEKAFYGWCSI